MKVRASVKRLCEFCYTVRRRGKLFVYCKKTPRHKQRQWFSTEAAAEASSSPAECVACTAPLAPSAPSFALPAVASLSSPPVLSLSGMMTMGGGGARAGFGGAAGGATGGFTLGEVHRQAALLLGGGRR